MKAGIKSKACTVDDDCFGEEKCDLSRKTCKCMMWSPREQFGTAVYNNVIYLSGGYVSQLYPRLSTCGDYACGDEQGSTYRYYMGDTWFWSGLKTDSWVLMTEVRTFPGRGGLQLLAFPDASGVPYLWVIGGRGGDNSGKSPDLVYYNDIWRAMITKDGIPILFLSLPFSFSLLSLYIWRERKIYN